MDPLIDQQQLRQEIFSQIGADGLPPETQEAVLAAAGKPVLQSVTFAILMALPEKAQEQFQRALAEGKSDLVRDIIVAYIPDSTTFIAAEVQKAAAEFRERFQQELAA